MKIKELLNIEGLNLTESLMNSEVTGLSLDSREVKPGNIFFSIKGSKTDGRKFLSTAIENGALLIIADIQYKEDYVKTENIIFVQNIRQVMAELSCRYYGNPSKKLKIAGITGTNGKTTIAYMIKSILDEAGYECGLIGTIDYITGVKKVLTARLTTPDAIELNRMLGEMAENGTEYCAMEVSSIALTSNRVYGIDFESAVFTNLTSEHMDLHSNMENYFEAKKILFDNLRPSKTAISNFDDPYGKRILADCKGNKKSYSIDSESDLKAENIQMNLNGLHFRIKYNNKEYNVDSTLTGRFNVYNILAAILSGTSMDIPIEVVLTAISKFKAAKGRFNRTMLPNGACAIVDYSHTSDSLKNAIEAAIDVRNSDSNNGKVITVFGCGGDRDKTKRPVMGKIATDLSDYVIITSDNPRTEDPNMIINDIIAGIEKNNDYTIEPDRETAIKMGIEKSRKGDIILICGKGHETYQEVNGVKSHFDDQEIILNNLDLANN